MWSVEILLHAPKGALRGELLDLSPRILRENAFEHSSTSQKHSSEHREGAPGKRGIHGAPPGGSLDISVKQNKFQTTRGRK